MCVNNKGKLPIFSSFLPRYRKGGGTSQELIQVCSHRPRKHFLHEDNPSTLTILADLLLQPQGWRDGSFRDPDLIPSTHVASHNSL